VAALVVLIVAALLAMRWRHGEFDWSLLASTLLAVRGRWLAAALLVGLATYYGRALRWSVLIRHLRPDASLWSLFSATAIGFTAIVLFGRPGELVRPYLIASKERLPFSSQLAAWFLERICDLLSTLLIFGFALAYVANTGIQVGPRLQWTLEAGGYFAGILGSVSLLVVLVLRQYSAPMRRRFVEALAVFPSRLRGKAIELFDAFILGIEATRTRLGLAGIIGYTVLEWALIVLSFVALVRAFPALDALAVPDVLILMGFVSFGSLVQIPGIGGGLQVVAIVVLTEIFHTSFETAAGIALMIWCVSFLVIVPFGLTLFVREGMTWRKIKEIKQVALK